MPDSGSLLTAELWDQTVYAAPAETVDPYRDLRRFRDRSTGFSGNNDFWKTPSPEPQLPQSLLLKLSKTDASPELVNAAAQLACRIKRDYDRRPLTLIAILRAGVPVAHWLTRLIPDSRAVACSLFVGVGIDRAALDQIRRDHVGRDLIFVDGWTGKGGVAGELSRLSLGPLAVLCDPWCLAKYRGTRNDLLSPSACFTGPTTLGFSRTFTRDDDQIFAAYRFPKQCLKPELVSRWSHSIDPIVDGSQHLAAPDPDLQPPGSGPKTDLRLHSNEVCRAMINSNPGTLYFADGPSEARRRYELLLAMADSLNVPQEFDCRELQRYSARVACSLRLKP